MIKKLLLIETITMTPHRKRIFPACLARNILSLVSQQTDDLTSDHLGESKISKNLKFLNFLNFGTGNFDER